MPPRQKKPEVTEIPEPAVMRAVEPEKDPFGIYVGDFVHVVTLSGAKHKSAEVLSYNMTGLVLRTSTLGPTQAEVSLIPWSAIDGVGLIGKR